MFYSILPVPKFYQLLFLTGFLFFQYFSSHVFADESKTIERLIEFTDEGLEQELSDLDAH